MKNKIKRILQDFIDLVPPLLFILVLVILHLYIDIDQIKTLGEGIKPLTEAIAIFVAGYWSYNLFIKNRKNYPYAEQTHRITHWLLDNGKTYLSVIVTVKNAGSVLLEINSGKIFVQQIRPLLDEMRSLIDNAAGQEIGEGKVESLFDSKGMQIAWRELGYREPSWEEGEIIVEPGEREEFQYDFILDETVRTVKIITYFHNAKIRKSDIGWRYTSIYNIE